MKIVIRFSVAFTNAGVVGYWSSFGHEKKRCSSVGRTLNSLAHLMCCVVKYVESRSADGMWLTVFSTTLAI